MLITALLNVSVFLATSVFWVLLLMVVPSVTSNFYLAPVLSQTQSLVSLRMRSLASAVMLLVINVIGLAIGPGSGPGHFPAPAHRQPHRRH